MSYAIKQDILDQMDEDVLIQLTDDTDAGAVNDAIVAKAIDRADAEVDGHCQGRYDIPLSPAPDTIRDRSVDIAIYHLYSRRGEPPGNIVERYKAAIRFLEKIATGAIRLGALTPVPTDGNQPIRVNKTASDRIFPKSVLNLY